MQEKVLQGTALSGGISIGKAIFCKAREAKVPEYSITSSQVDEEVARYRKALFSSKEDLEKLKSHSACETAEIIDSHLCMLEDPLITEQMERQIRADLQKPETVFQNVMSHYQKRFSQNTSSFFQERLVDVADLAHRVLGHLCQTQESQALESCVLFVDTLLPSHVASLESSAECALVTTSAASHSHATLIAREKGIPYVGGIDLKLCLNASLDTVVVDAEEGKVILNPSEETLKRYREKSKILSKRSLPSVGPALTQEGKQIHLYENVSCLKSFEGCKETLGVGLFRSESLLFDHPSLLFSEADQRLLYEELIQKMQGKPLTFRLFDIGGDKLPSGMEEKERGLGLLLKEQEIFKTQVRAIVKASRGSHIKLLLPFVYDASQFVQAKNIILNIEPSLEIGCMIELPSAALLIADLAKVSDFFSIGTSDLAQFTLGVDRALLSSLPFPYLAHPSLIRLLKRVFDVCHKKAKSVTVCGDAASDPFLTPLLLGLGADQLSISSFAFPSVKKAIAAVSYQDMRALVKRLLRMPTAEGVARLFKEALNNSSFES